MSKRNDAVSMKHMLDHAREAVAMVEGRTRDQLERDRMLQLALTRLIEIVGEAASRVSPETRERHPEVPWAQIVGMRHRLTHGYDIIDWDLLWDTICEDMPPLMTTLQTILEERSS